MTDATRLDLVRLLSGGGHAVVAVSRWGLVEFEHPARGINIAGTEAGYPRLSSHVLAIDADAMAATTASGRVYVLVGNPDPDYAMEVPAGFAKLDGSRYRVVGIDEAAATLGNAAEASD
ncbi:MAG: hypothetical protein AB7I79_03050 [Rhizobiaceae bacterium]